MTKRIIAIMLALLCALCCFVACSDEESNESENASGTSTEATAPVPEGSTLISGENRYRIVYADGISKNIALKVYDKLNSLDPAASGKIGYYKIGTDKKTADDGSAEILIGNTNRALSSEAKKALKNDMDFAIVVSGNKIAIYANTEARVEDAVNYFVSKITLTESKQVLYSATGTYVEEYVPGSVNAITIDGAPISEFTIVIPSKNYSNDLSFAEALADYLIEQSGEYVAVEFDSVEESEHEILVGKTNRTESDSITASSMATSEFKTAIKNGKLAIAADSYTGYNIALASFKNVLKNNNGAITTAFTPKRLSFEEIKAISVGSIRFTESAGVLSFYKSTEAQITAWGGYNADLKTRSETTTGVRLDFETDSSSFYFETPTTSVKFELYINGEKSQDLTGKSAHFIELDTSANDTNRVTLIFPSHNIGKISTVQFDGGATVTRHQFDKKILFIGDSITQGYNSGVDSVSYAHIVTRHFNADSVIQGVGGAAYSHINALSAIPYDPDVVIVALGCNDWNNNSNATDYRNRVTTYLNKIDQLYGDKTVIVISPIPRLDETSSATLPLASARNIISQEASSRGFVHVNGGDLVPANATYYATNDTYHPNAKGFEEYAKNLIPLIETYVEEA